MEWTNRFKRHSKSQMRCVAYNQLIPFSVQVKKTSVNVCNREKWRLAKPKRKAHYLQTPSIHATLELNSIICLSNVTIHTQRQMESPKFVRMHARADSQKSGLSKQDRAARRFRGGSTGFSAPSRGKIGHGPTLRKAFAIWFVKTQTWTF